MHLYFNGYARQGGHANSDNYQSDNKIMIMNRKTKEKSTIERIGNRCKVYSDKYHAWTRLQQLLKKRISIFRQVRSRACPNERQSRF